MNATTEGVASTGSAGVNAAMRHGVVGVGADVHEVLEKATTGYAGPIGPDYTVLRWKEGEWVE